MAVNPAAAPLGPPAPTPIATTTPPAGKQKLLTRVEQFILALTKEDMKIDFSKPYMLKGTLDVTHFDGKLLRMDISKHPKIKQYIEYILTGKGKSPYEGQRVGYLANGSYHAPKIPSSDNLWLDKHLTADPIVYNNGARIASKTPTTTPPTTTPPTTTPPTPSTTVPHKRVPAVTGAPMAVNPAAATPGGVPGVFTPPGGGGGNGINTSTVITFHLPPAIASAAGVNKNFKGTIKDLTLQVEGNSRLAQYFQSQAAASGASLYNANGKFNHAALQGVFEIYQAGVAAHQDPNQVLNSAFHNLGAVAAAAAKAEAINLANQDVNVLTSQNYLAAATANASASARSTASNALETFFSQYGIDSTRVPAALLKGFTQEFTNMVYGQGTVPTSQTAKDMFKAYDNGKLYDAAFPGLSKYNGSAAGKVVPMGIPEYNAYRNAFKGLSSTYNLPASALSDANLATLISGGVSIKSLTDRINIGWQTYQNGDAEVKRKLQSEWGVTPAQMVHHLLDPKNASTAIIQQSQQAKYGSEAASAGFKGEMSGKQAQNIYQYGQSSNIAESSLRQGIDQAARYQSLIGSAPGQARQGVTQEQLIAASVGYDPAAKQAVDIARAQQAAPTSGGGGDVMNQKGVTGAGYAASN